MVSKSDNLADDLCLYAPQCKIPYPNQRPILLNASGYMNWIPLLARALGLKAEQAAVWPSARDVRVSCTQVLCRRPLIYSYQTLM